MLPIIQSSTRAAATTEQPFSFKPGQVIHGSIKKIFPDQMAEVQVGNKRMLARLEVPLKAGDAHYFQVEGEKAALHLKVVTGAIQSTTTSLGQTQQLMDSLQLPKSALMESIVQQMVRGKMPLSREQLIQAEQWMKDVTSNVKTSEGLVALQKMTEHKLSFTRESFLSLVSGQDKNGLHQLLDTFRQSLQKDTTIPTVQREGIEKLLSQISQPFSKELGGAIAGQVIQRLLSPTASVDDRTALLNLLKAVGLVSQEATLDNWLSRQTIVQPGQGGQNLSLGQILAQIQQPILAEGVVQSLQTMVADTPHIMTEGKVRIEQLINKVALSVPESPEWRVAIKTLTTEILRAFAEATQSQPFQADQKSLTPKDQVLSILNSLSGTNKDSEVLSQLTRFASQSTQSIVQQVFSSAEAAVHGGMNHLAIGQAVKQILGNIGFSYEAKLSQQGADLTQLNGSLKPQLLSIVQNHSVSAQVKEAAESIISRLNGMQILSGENGPQHQLLMQVPLDFFGKRMDAAIQWNGRMKENGKIDSSYARVMFYLDLASLKQTVIDMQVQNRVITINIYNENDALLPLAESFREALRTGLGSLDYQLSGVFIKSFDNQPAPPPILSKMESDNGGVDIRI
jgi:hypothetical protein